MLRNVRVAHTLLWCLALLPACFTAWLIARYSVDVLYGDEWGLAIFFHRLADGSFRFSNLLMQQNEFRQTVPYIIIIGLGWLTGWDVRYEMWFSFLIICFVAFNLYRVVGITAPHLTCVQRLLLLGAINLLIFSPIQFESWFNGIQIVYFMPIVCLSSCVHIAYLRLNFTTKFLLCICLATISTFSSANGLVCWIIALPVLVLANRSQSKTHIAALTGVWVVACALNLVGYFYDYHKPEIQPSTTEALSHPLAAVAYFLCVLGTPLAPGKGLPTIVLASMLGACMLALFIFVCVALWKNLRNDDFTRRMIAGIAISSYSVVTALMITVGRVGFGVEQALAPRYTTFTVYLAVGLICLVPVLPWVANNKFRLAFKRRLLLKLSFCFALGILVLHLIVSVQAVFRLQILQARLLYGKACVAFINVVHADCTEIIFPDRNYLQAQANSLDRLGYLTPGLIKSSNIRAAIEADNSQNAGTFDALTQTSTSGFEAFGRALLPKRSEAADAVLLAYKDERNDSVVFALTSTRRAEVGVLDLLRESKDEQASWRVKFSLSQLPHRPVRLSAWAYDAVAGKAYQLAGEHQVP